MIDFVEVRQWVIGMALLFFAYAFYYEYAKSRPDRMRRKLLSVGAVAFIIGSVFATVSAQKSGCPGGEPKVGDIGEITDLLLPSCVSGSAGLRSVYTTEADMGESGVWSLTNRISFDSFAQTATSRVFGIGWSKGLSSYFPLLDLSYKSDLTNDEWSVFRTEDIGGLITNGIVLEIVSDQMPTNSVFDKAFYTACMRKDPNPYRNSDGDHWSDREELGYVERLTGDDYLWFDISGTGTDLIYPAWRKVSLWKHVYFAGYHVLGDAICNAAQVGLDGYVYFRDIESPFDDECCPGVHAVEIDPTADARYWGSGVYSGSVVTNGVTYDVLEFQNIGLYDCYGMSSSPLVSYEVILSSAEPNVVYVSYANVDAGFLSRQERVGYFDSTRASVFDSGLPYRLTCLDEGGAISPYTTVRYCIGTGTDPRIYDTYDYPMCGQTDEERMFVETSVGYGLTNGLYELKATLSDTPVVPVVITVGDDVVVMTNAGDCVFLCEKGKSYSLSVSPTFSPNVEFSARDDIAPPMMMVGASGDAGAVWTVDSRLTLEQPFGGIPGSCLWLPTFTAGPNVLGHWYPDDGGMRFTAYLTDYPGSNTISYSWSCSDENVHIASPSSQSTMVSLRNSPGWGSTDLLVTATVDGYSLSSTLENLEYGAHSSPEVHLELDAPAAILLNSNEVSSAKLRRFELHFHSDIPTNGIIRLRVQGNTDAVELWETTNRTTRIPNMKSWASSEFTEFSGYIEGIGTSGNIGDVCLEAKYLVNGVEESVSRRQITVVDVGIVRINTAGSDFPLFLTNQTVELNVEICPSNAQGLVFANWKLRKLTASWEYDEWYEHPGSDHRLTCHYDGLSGGIYQSMVSVSVTPEFDGDVIRWLVWGDNENASYGCRRKNENLSFGVVSESWQKNLVQCARAFLGSTNYLATSYLPAQYGFDAHDRGSHKCNIFVAHRIVESGLTVPFRHFWMGSPPLANDWADVDCSIAHWSVCPDNCCPQPGFIFADADEGDHGHMGILDFDGAGISAGLFNVNRKYEPASGDVTLRKYGE